MVGMIVNEVSYRNYETIVIGSTTIVRKTYHTVVRRTWDKRAKAVNHTRWIEVVVTFAMCGASRLMRKSNSLLIVLFATRIVACFHGEGA